MTESPILITGAAGFIGYHLSEALLERGIPVFGIDNLNPYYDVKLKEDRLARLISRSSFTFHQLDLCERASVEKVFANQGFSRVVHLAAQAGVRYSLENPHAYLEANLIGFMNVIDAARRTGCQNFIYASSSSVYGANTQLPFAVTDNVDHPVSLYAATKKSNELIAHAYSVNHGLPTTGLRFFTVYGPWGRPDMALFIFTKAILEGQPIDVYNHGDMQRDFTYVGDIVEGISRLLDQSAKINPNWNSDSPDPSTSFAPYRVYNIGNNQPVKLMDFIHEIEKQLVKKAKINFMPIQPGDVPATFADVQALKLAVDYKPDTPLSEGIAAFVSWYTSYYGS